MYQALYRKWRPKTFSDVIGQSHITQTLRKQVAEGRTSHAYLFTGTRGTGKTTCAKILAKAVNCEHPMDGDPCCQCPSCVGIENGSFLDVLELDAASNNGVDQVRALRDEAIYAPANVKKRVYIVDEVHMLSTPAFNALLKILEEPPEHLMFILATTELHKVPATILSRCQRFSFKRITPQDIAARLLYVAGQEQIDLTADGAELLSRLADGALRDGLSLLDQCAAVGGTVDSRAVLEALGLAGNLQTAQLMEFILRAGQGDSRYPADLPGHYAAKGHGGPLLQLQPPHGCGALPPAAVRRVPLWGPDGPGGPGPAAGRQCPTGAASAGGRRRKRRHGEAVLRPRTAPGTCAGGCPASGRTASTGGAPSASRGAASAGGARSAGVRRTGGAARRPLPCCGIRCGGQLVAGAGRGL